NGRAVVKMNIYKKYQPIYRNATVLLRPRTPLKDMYLELDPGTEGSGAIPNHGTLGAGATNPDVDFSEILSSLDTDTRGYLLPLLAGGAQAVNNPGTPAPAPGRRAALQEPGPAGPAAEPGCGQRPARDLPAFRPAQPQHGHIHEA